MRFNKFLNSQLFTPKKFLFFFLIFLKDPFNFPSILFYNDQSLKYQPHRLKYVFYHLTPLKQPFVFSP